MYVYRHTCTHICQILKHPPDYSSASSSLENSYYNTNMNSEQVAIQDPGPTELSTLHFKFPLSLALSADDGPFYICIFLLPIPNVITEEMSSSGSMLITLPPSCSQFIPLILCCHSLSSPISSLLCHLQ